MRNSTPFLLLPLLAVLASACTGDDGVGETDELETVNPAVVEGLTPEEISERAEPVSPEEAEQRGIVDSTIHLEDPRDIDTVLPVDTTS